MATWFRSEYAHEQEPSGENDPMEGQARRSQTDLTSEADQVRTGIEAEESTN